MHRNTFLSSLLCAWCIWSSRLVALKVLWWHICLTRRCRTDLLWLFEDWFRYFLLRWCCSWLRVLSICFSWWDFWVKEVVDNLQPFIDDVLRWQPTILKNELFKSNIFFNELVSCVFGLAWFDKDLNIVLFQVFDAGSHRFLIRCGHDQKMVVLVTNLSWLIVHCFLFIYIFNYLN